VLKFVGVDEGRSEELTARLGGVTPVADAHASVPPPARYPLRARLGLIVGPFRRNGNGRRTGTELVSERWSPSEELQLELDRSRRFGHHFALVRITRRREFEDGWTCVRDLACELNALLRRVDRVWIDGAGVYMLLPECNRTMVEAMLARIHEPLSRMLGEEPPAVTATAIFPDDGMTSAALLGSLNGNQTAPRVPDKPAA
jgi:hypothetical protein